MTRLQVALLDTALFAVLVAVNYALWVMILAVMYVAGKIDGFHLLWRAWAVYGSFFLMAREAMRLRKFLLKEDVKEE